MTGYPNVSIDSHWKQNSEEFCFYFYAESDFLMLIVMVAICCARGLWRDGAGQSKPPDPAKYIRNSGVLLVEQLNKATLNTFRWYSLILRWSPERIANYVPTHTAYNIHFIRNACVYHLYAVGSCQMLLNTTANAKHSERMVSDLVWQKDALLCSIAHSRRGHCLYCARVIFSYSTFTYTIRSQCSLSRCCMRVVWPCILVFCLYGYISLFNFSPRTLSHPTRLT